VLGGGVPGQDVSVERLADYGVVRRGDQRGEELLGLKTTALLNIKKLARATKITVDGHCLRALLKGSVSEDSACAVAKRSQLSGNARSIAARRSASDRCKYRLSSGCWSGPFRRWTA
jgi:hypothetical protein